MAEDTSDAPEVGSKGTARTRETDGGESGPSATADWERLTLDGTGVESDLQAVRVLPDADPDAGVQHVLADRPSVSVGTDAPSVGVTLLLKRQPRPDEMDVYDLVRHGTVSVGINLGLPPRVAAALEERSEHGDGNEDEQTHQVYRPLYAREAQFDLVKANSGTVLASATGSGSAPAGTLAVSLDRSEALAFVAALRGESPTPPLRVDTTITFRTATESRRVRISGEWATIHDHLADELGAETPFSVAELRVAFASLVESDSLTVEGVDDPTAVLDRLFEVFQRQALVVLDPVSDGHYVLGTRPYSGFSFTGTETVRPVGERSVTLETPLESIVGGVLDGHDWERYVRLHVLDMDRPDRSVLRRTRRSRRNRRDASRDPSRLMLVDGGARTLSAELTASGLRTDLPQATWKPTLAGDAAKWALFDDFKAGSLAPRPRHLPVVDYGKEKESAWPDRTDAKRYWYAPSFQPVTPDPSTSGDGSFEFDVQVLGKTPEGTHALRADIQIELEPVVPESARNLEDQYELRPVELVEPKVFLEIPYFDRNARQTRHQTVPGTATRDGDGFVATFELVDEWVELCYGALSTEDFQELEPRIRIQYGFEAYYEADDRTAVVTVGGKLATLPVAYGDRVGPEPVYFDARAATLHLPGRTVRLGSRRSSDFERPEPPHTSEREAPNAHTGSVAPTSLADGAGTQGTGHFPLLATTTVTPVNNVNHLIRPTINVMDVVRPSPPIEPPDVQEPEYGVRTVGRESAVEILYQCETHGDRYQRTVDGETEAIGCDDAFALDEVEFKLYRNRSDVLTPALRKYVTEVLQSRLLPNRYLIVPNRYRIDRYEPDHERAYQLRALLHSMVSLDVAETRSVFSFRLAPDVPVFARRILSRVLRDSNVDADDPVFEYPPGVADDVTYDWLVWTEFSSGEEVVPTVLESDERLFVQIGTGLLDGAQLVDWLEQNGVLGAATFSLTDGSEFRCDLELDPGRPTGPWEAGPVAVRSTRSGVELFNPTANPLDVTALLAEDGREVPAEVSLEPGTSQLLGQVAVGIDPTPMYAERPVSGTSVYEQHLFVENIDTNVIFTIDDAINLAVLGIDEVHVRLGLVESEGTWSVTLTPGSTTAEVLLTLPLTRYLKRPVVRYRLETIRADGRSEISDWTEQDLSSAGPFVYLEEEDLP